MAGFLLGQKMRRLRSCVADSSGCQRALLVLGCGSIGEGFFNCADRGGGPHFADSVRNDVFSILGERKRREACATRLGESLIG